MQTNQILAEIDRQISQLQQARALLSAGINDASSGKRRSRPNASLSKITKEPNLITAKRGRRTMSAEGKARIAAAQKARWAAQKKADQPAKAPTKKTATKRTSVKKAKAAPPMTESTTETGTAEA